MRCNIGVALIKKLRKKIEFARLCFKEDKTEIVKVVKGINVKEIKKYRKRGWRVVIENNFLVDWCKR